MEDNNMEEDSMSKKKVMDIEATIDASDTPADFGIPEAFGIPAGAFSMLLQQIQPFLGLGRSERLAILSRLAERGMTQEELLQQAKLVQSALNAWCAEDDIPASF